MQYIIRNKSILTNKENLEPLYTFKDFPAFMGCVEHNQEQDLRADMSWAICPETGVIQLDKLIPLEILYQVQHADGVGPTWRQYYCDLADYIIQFKPKNILEIGGGQGDIAEIFTQKTKGTTWTMIEPNPLHQGNERIKIIRAFFDENFKYEGSIDTIVFSQLLEHIYNPQEFIHNIASYLQPGHRLIFGYPDLKLMLEQKYTNALNFEHTMFLTDYFVDYLLIKNGFKIIDKRPYKHHLFYAAERLAKPDPLPELENKYDEYKKIFMDFINHHLAMVQDLNKKIEEARGPIYLFGAHIFSLYLIQFGLRTDKIICILDNSQLKRGKRLYGTSFIVQSPQILKDKGKVNVILKAGLYNDEIKKDILENINKEVVFW